MPGPLPYPATNCTANVATKSRYAFSDAGDDELVHRIAALSWALTGDTTFAQNEENSGLFNREDRFVTDKTKAGGTVSLYPRPDDMLWMLPNLIGEPVTANTSTLFRPGRICPFFACGRWDTHVGYLFKYLRCATARASFSSSDSANGLLKLDWQIEGSEEEITPLDADGVPTGNTLNGATGTSTFDVGLLLSSQRPFVHRESELLIGTAAVPLTANRNERIKDIQVVIENTLLQDEYYNSQYRYDMPHDGQRILVSHNSPFDSEEDVKRLKQQNVSARITYTNGPLMIRFDFPRLIGIQKAPTVGARGRLLYPVQWEAALPIGSNPDTGAVPYTVTIDATP